jgi:hypothetical protein
MTQLSRAFARPILTDPLCRRAPSFLKLNLFSRMLRHKWDSLGSGRRIRIVEYHSLKLHNEQEVKDRSLMTIRTSWGYRYGVQIQIPFPCISHTFSPTNEVLFLQIARPNMHHIIIITNASIYNAPMSKNCHGPLAHAPAVYTVHADESKKTTWPPWPPVNVTEVSTRS